MPKPNKVVKDKKVSQKDAMTLTFSRPMGSNLKYVDTGLGGSDITNTTTGVVLIPSATIIGTGTSQSTRVGKRIFVVKMDYRIGAVLGFESNSNISSSTYRLTCVRDDQTKGSTPVYTDVYQAGAINAFKNTGNASRFKFLKIIDKAINSGLVYNTNVNQYNRYDNTQVHMGSVSVNDYVEFASTNTDGAVSGTIRGAIVLLAIGNNTKVTFINADTACRVWYYDTN